MAPEPWGGPGLTVLPSHAARFAQLLRAASIDPEIPGKGGTYEDGKYLSQEEATQKLMARRAESDPWTKKLYKALNVDFSQREGAP